MKRDKQIDVARGIAIILVIVGHCCGSLDFYLNKIILSFHMPLFFFLSGMMAKPWAGRLSGGGPQFLRKMRTLLIPQITLLIIQFTVTAVDNISDGRRLPDVLNIIFGYWFLPVLFLVSVLYLVLSMFLDVNDIRVLVATVIIDIIAINGVLLLKQYGIEITYVSIVPMAFFFYICGHIFCTYKEGIIEIKDWLTHKNPFICGFIGIILAMAFFVIVDINSPVAMYNNNYGNPLLFVIAAFLGIAGAWFMAGKLKDSAYLNWCGCNSIVIYVWQFAICKICRGVAMRLTVAILPERSELVWFLTASIAALCCVIPIVLFSNRFIPEIYGKNKS